VAISGLDKFNKELAKIIEKTKNELQDTVKTEIATRTPIDSGRARRGWSKRSSGKDRIVKNTVPYIERLEGGYSRQAPNGFTKQAVKATMNKRTK
jgi:hypothetical protein